MKWSGKFTPNCLFNLRKVSLELLQMPDCVPLADQALRPSDGLRGLGKCYAIGIALVEANRAAEFLCHPVGHPIEHVEGALDFRDRPGVHDLAEAVKI